MTPAFLPAILFGLGLDASPSGGGAYVPGDWPRAVVEPRRPGAVVTPRSAAAEETARGHSAVATRRQ
jgi:hypothetical protein